MPSRKDEILDIATRLFAERGYEGASMGDLAERVGLRKASLFHHYASKDELYCAVLEQLVRRLGELVFTNAAGPGTFAERLDRMTVATFDAMVAEPFAAALLIREMMDWGPFAKKHFDSLAKPVMEATTGFFESGQKEGAAKVQDARQVILTVTSMNLMPFAIGQFIRCSYGTEPFSPDFIASRREAIRAHARAIVLLDAGKP